MNPTFATLRAAVAASSTSTRPNYAAAARACGISRASLLARLGLVERRGGRVGVSVEQARAAVEKYGSQRAAARALGVSEATIRNRLKS